MTSGGPVVGCVWLAQARCAHVTAKSRLRGCGRPTADQPQHAEAGLSRVCRRESPDSIQCASADTRYM